MKMPLYEIWCDKKRSKDKEKISLRLTERKGGRAIVSKDLSQVVRSHYDVMDRIAADVRRLGYDKAAALLAERLPRSKKARSGELGEILATELVEEELGYLVPVRRLRYKDGREMALRGDDLLGVSLTGGRLKLLKGESKSRAKLTKTVISQARAALSRDTGRPTSTSLVFVADRLMDHGGAEAGLGERLRDEVVARAVPASRIEHVLFSVSGNAPPAALDNDLSTASDAYPQTSIHLHIEDHQDFIKKTYEMAVKLGED